MITKLNIYKKYTLMGIPIILLLYIPLHLLYKYSGNSTIIGLFTPINNSNFEYLKLTFYPTLLWWFLGYYFIPKKEPLNNSNWFVTATISSIISSTLFLVILFLFTEIIKNHSMLSTIFSLFLSILISQIISISIYEKANYTIYDIYSCISLLFFVILIFTFFTFIPPHYPIFQDPITKTYGIVR